MTEQHGYTLAEDGIYRRIGGTSHRDEEYDSAGFDTLLDMQERHFWYRGRHRFLLHALQSAVRRQRRSLEQLRLIDLGGGCGGWIKYLADQGVQAAELALADSSLLALGYTSDVLPHEVSRYQIDLLHLEWRDRWDVAFLLDVLEHIPPHEEALRQTYEALTPGGLLFITTPALQRFWTYNDDLVHHVRRYSKGDYRQLASDSGFTLLDARYFMFFLSPLLLASRWFGSPELEKMTEEERHELMARTHKVPGTLANGLLGTAFAAETPLGHWLPFPWGTSILAIMQKPAFN